MRSAGRAVAAMFGLLVLSGEGEAWASPTARLDYRRAPGVEACPDEAALRRAVRERLGYDPFVAEARQSLLATITPGEHDLRGEVRLVDADGTPRGSRELRAPAPECAELVSRMALAIAIAIDPDSLDRPAPAPDEAASTEVTPAPAAPPAPPAPPAKATPSGEPRPLRVEQEPPWVAEIVLGLPIAVGLAPSLAVGPSLGLGVRRGLSSLTLEGRYLVMDPVRSRAGHVKSTLAEAALVACFRPSLGLLCAEASFGRLTVVGDLVVRSRTDRAFVPRLGPRLGVDLPFMGALTFRPQLAALFALRRPQVVLDGVSVWESPPIGLLLSLSVTGHVP